MAKVTATIVTTTEALPSGFSSFNEYLYIINKADGTGQVQTGASAQPTFEFPSDVPPGDYIMSAQASGVLTAGGSQPIGTAVTATFTVPPVVVPPTTFASPTSVTVALS